MKPLEFLAKFFFKENEAIAADRDRIMGPTLGISGILMALLLVANIVAGRYILSAAIALASAALVTNWWSLKHGAKPRVPYAVLLALVLAGVSVAMVQLGLIGAFWAYPTLIICCFALPRRTGFIFIVVAIIVVTSIAASSFSPSVAFRVCASLVLTWICMNVMMNVLVDLYERLQQQAITDPLTGALNRRQMDITLGELLRRARGRPVPASILLIDIDNFKQINDRRGHAVGDEVLVQLVRLITARKRTVDSLYRIGGEEFLLLLQDSSALAASVVAEQLRALIEDASLAKDVPITISIGVAECEAGYAPSEWLKAADEALYRAKEGGRNRVENSTFGDSRPQGAASDLSQA